jgi:Fe-S-cluster containining protein
MPNACMTCGACCALFRVVFAASETDDQPGGVVPVGLTIDLGLNRRAMRGTEGRPKRCIALVGTVGGQVFCSVYCQRPSACRHFLASWEAVGHNPSCLRARAVYGLNLFDCF